MLTEESIFSATSNVLRSIRSEALHFVRMRILTLLLGIILSLGYSNGYHFLMVLNSPGRSHFNVGQALAKGLVNAGHEITVVSVFPQKKNIPGYHDINVPNIIAAMKGDIAALWDSINKPLTQKLIDHYQMGFRLTRGLFVDPNFQDLIKSNRSFDAIICKTFYNDAHYGLAEHFNAPLIGLSTGGGLTFITDMVGSPAPASFVPHIMLPFNDHMSLYERFMNVAFLAFERLLLDYYYLPGQEKLYKEFFPENKHNFYEMRRNASLVLINQHVSLLPEKIERFLNESDHGAIYFSMGSNLKSKDLPPSKVEEILTAFRGLKQRVLWKFELDDLPNKPENLYISDWFPQTDILAHPKVLAFVTHGGMLSTTESIYHGKPVIGLPIFSDQFFNMAHAEQAGYGIMLDFKNLKAKDFGAAIESIVSDSTYTEVVRGMSFRYRDQQQTPLENAIYWVEHVTRHQGAAYLKSAAQRLNWWQYHNVDVFAIMFAIFIVLLILPFFILRLTKRVFCVNGKKVQKFKQN
ncbi:LOW QUALITY PROTEIN: uncharacterized protein Dana_GF18262, partial [Drosophila ananassae]